MASSRARRATRLLAAACLLVAASDCSRKSPWEALPLGTSADFRDIRFTDADHGFIAGGGYQIVGGLIGRTADAGKTWRFTSDLTSRERMMAMSLHFFDSARGLVAASSGVFLSTNDGGETWTAV